ncbi:hypothetical protein KXQ82_03290 [Mucilaginibacter sp. HMF5004]|uniref:hypothetical protein n=1 Tax=Mucilaginibacter rivuli TaxID=2857527 RepID=UPI001C5E72AD|nr:hypothetical protein [Mucilaginibacter rivuli]MBW4888718.1 hypothetical protein [Mucilaginibacter rivuli]
MQSEIFEAEEIPDNGILYYRVHKSYIVNNEVIPGAFRSRGDGMSTDWNKYSTPEESLLRAKVPAENSIINFPVTKIRSRSALAVIHNPEIDNRAHSLIKGIPEVKGDLQTKTRALLTLIYVWEIKISPN